MNLVQLQPRCKPSPFPTKRVNLAKNRSRNRRNNFTEVFEPSFATYFDNDDDDSPDTAETSQSSVTIEQFMTVYTAKVLEESANPGQQVHVANCDVEHSAYITAAPPPITDHNRHSYSTRRELPPSLIRRMMSSPRSTYQRQLDRQGHPPKSTDRLVTSISSCITLLKWRPAID